MSGSGVAAVLLCVLLACFSGGCASYDAFHARYREPRYLVTHNLYEEAPHRIAVLPFAGPTDNQRDMAKGAVCRKMFYQQISVTPYEDVGLHKTDHLVLRRCQDREDTVFGRLFEHVRKVDLIGVTSVLSLSPSIDASQFDQEGYTNLVSATRSTLGADACFVGYTRSYGRFYAVVFCSMGLSTMLELRSANTGNLLWRGEASERSYEIPLTLNPMDIPTEIVNIWKSSMGIAMDMLAFGVYRDLAGTIPYVSAPRKVFVKARSNQAPYFRSPTTWLVGRSGILLAGEVFPFLVEQNGWYQCLNSEGQAVWIFRRHAMLVDESGYEVKSSGLLQTPQP